MIWLLAIAQPTAPTATNMAGLFRGEDTPVAIMPGKVLKSVNTAVTVTPQGKIQDCKVEVSSGIQKLDAHTCALLIRRAKFRPALDRDGTSIYGVYRTQIDWWVGDGYPPLGRTIPEVSMTVKTLPPKTKSPAVLRLMFRVDPFGHVSDCSLQDKKGDPGLVKLGCEALIKGYTATPARNFAGALVASVQTATVLFEARP